MGIFSRKKPQTDKQARQPKVCVWKKDESVSGFITTRFFFHESLDLPDMVDNQAVQPWKQLTELPEVIEVRAYTSYVAVSWRVPAEGEEETANIVVATAMEALKKRFLWARVEVMYIRGDELSSLRAKEGIEDTWRWVLGRG